MLGDDNGILLALAATTDSDPSLLYNVAGKPTLDTRPLAVTPLTPLRLGTAAALAFPDGSLNARSLRREAQRGRLEIERIAGKDYTTLAAIERMRELCRVAPKDLASGSSPAVPAEMSKPSGSSETKEISEAQAALMATVRKLKKSLPSTSCPKARRRASATVTPLR